MTGTVTSSSRCCLLAGGFRSLSRRWQNHICSCLSVSPNCTDTGRYLMSIKQYKHRSTNHNGYPNTVYHLFIYSIYVKTGQELPHGRQQSNTMPTWATSVKKHCPSRFSLETHCKDTSSLYSKTCSPTIRRAWDLNKSSQVSSDAATSSRGTDAGVGQGASGKPQGRSWHHRVSG